MKFTFKTEKPTGRYRAFDNPRHLIKLNNKECGTIQHDAPHQIKLCVIKKDINEDGNPNCSWRWIRLKGEFGSVEEAKLFLIENTGKVLERYELHLIE